MQRLFKATEFDNSITFKRIIEPEFSFRKKQDLGAL